MSSHRCPNRAIRVIVTRRVLGPARANGQTTLGALQLSTDVTTALGALTVADEDVLEGGRVSGDDRRQRQLPADRQPDS